MTSHIHMIVGTHDNPLEDIMRDMKKHTCLELRKAIQQHQAESSKEWMFMDDGTGR